MPLEVFSARRPFSASGIDKYTASITVLSGILKSIGWSIAIAWTLMLRNIPII
ncbi:MAG TPA: hypothetical protein VK671_11580 [Mucilaginibacter sp.]|nr:hypothetical protein [Mucilaginibacter sp.]